MTDTDTRMFYVRLRDFDYEDELSGVGPPRLVGKPISDADHIQAYREMLYTTKEAAIQSWFDEVAHLGYDAPEETICRAEVEEDGNVWCCRRVAKLDADGVEEINLDEDFGFWILRQDIFEIAGVQDDYRPVQQVAGR